jgi:broad specificity phosphatase PhoE
MPVIYLIRHAQASFGGGPYDLLSAVGERQSALLGAALSERGIRASRVVAGTLRRQRDTALGCLPQLDRRLDTDSRWNEYDTSSVLAAHAAVAFDDRPRTELGAPTGLTTREFQSLLDPALEAWVIAGERSDCGEIWPAFQQRALSALEQLAGQLGSGENGLAFASAGVIAAICTALLDGPATTFVALNRVSINSGVSKIIYGRGGPSLITFNDHAHLESDRTLVTFR